MQALAEIIQIKTIRRLLLSPFYLISLLDIDPPSLVLFRFYLPTILCSKLVPYARIKTPIHWRPFGWQPRQQTELKDHPLQMLFFSFCVYISIRAWLLGIYLSACPSVWRFLMLYMISFCLGFGQFQLFWWIVIEVWLFFVCSFCGLVQLFNGSLLGCCFCRVNKRSWDTYIL